MTILRKCTPDFVHTIKHSIFYKDWTEWNTCRCYANLNQCRNWFSTWFCSPVDNCGKQSVPPTPPRTTSSKPFVTSKGRRSYFAPNRGRPNKTPNPCGQIPVANISPRPSPLDSMLLSLTKSRDGALPRPPDVSTTWNVTSPESSDDADDDDDYLHPQMGYDDARSYLSERVGRNVSKSPSFTKSVITKTVCHIIQSEWTTAMAYTIFLGLLYAASNIESCQSVSCSTKTTRFYIQKQSPTIQVQKHHVMRKTLRPVNIREEST